MTRKAHPANSVTPRIILTPVGFPTSAEPVKSLGITVETRMAEAQETATKPPALPVKLSLPLVCNALSTLRGMILREVSVIPAGNLSSSSEGGSAGYSRERTGFTADCC